MMRMMMKGPSLFQVHLCEHCGQLPPDQELKAEMAMFGVENPCPVCGQPLKPDEQDEVQIEGPGGGSCR